MDGILRLLRSDTNDRSNIGNPNEMTVAGIAERIIRLTGSASRIVHQPLPVDDPKVRQPDIGRARRILDWEPRVSLTEGLTKTIAFVRNALADVRQR